MISKNISQQSKSPKPQSQIWQEQAKAAQNGDKKAYNALLQSISAFSRNFLLPRMANPEWAEDVTQDVLISVHKSLATYDPNQSFRPWLMAIVNFRKVDFLRKHYASRDHEKTTMDDASFLSQHVTNPTHQGELKDVENFMQSLPKKQRIAFQRTKVEGYSIAETAVELGMSVSAVKVSTHRTMNKLKKALNE
jgi:RNA polymerase sigma-70 factor (ECF subfamily)